MREDEVKAEHVNAFLVPSVQVIQKMARTEVRLGRISRLEEVRLDDNLSIVIGLQGRLSGSVILTAGRDVARKLASRMAGEDLGEEDAGEIRIIFAELANTIVGNATGHLYELGMREGITPPTVVTGPEVRFGYDSGVEIVCVGLETGVGDLQVIVCLTNENL